MRNGSAPDEPVCLDCCSAWPGWTACGAAAFAGAIRSEPELGRSARALADETKNACAGGGADRRLAHGAAAHSGSAASAGTCRGSGPSRRAEIAAAERHVVACTGIFSQGIRTTLRLAMTFDYKNVTFGDVDADGGAKVKATIVFPNDPKRRLEVWWSNPAERSGIYLIDIKGKSTWGAPDGMRLGLKPHADWKSSTKSRSSSKASTRAAWRRSAIGTAAHWRRCRAAANPA